MRFRYIPKDYKKKKGQLSFSPSGLCEDCPLQYFFSIKFKKEISEEQREIFDIGNDQHDQEVIFNKGSHSVILAEKKYKIMNYKFRYIVPAKPDHIKYDFKGRYIEDYKTCQYKSLKYFLDEEIPKKYVRQLSIYAFVYYINTGIRIERGIITKIDKIDPRNRVSREFKLMTIDETEDYILNHPTILYMTGQKDFEYLKNEAEKLIPYLDCNYCNFLLEHQALSEFNFEKMEEKK